MFSFTIRPARGRRIKWTSALVLVTSGYLISMIGLHDLIYPTEDSRIVHVCSLQGNRLCAPDANVIEVRLERLVSHP
jgi:hypothetical protein